jgi:hypothetical protein
MCNKLFKLVSIKNPSTYLIKYHNAIPLQSNKSGNKVNPMPFATLVCPAKQNIERKNSLIEHIV